MLIAQAVFPFERGHTDRNRSGEVCGELLYPVTLLTLLYTHKVTNATDHLTHDSANTTKSFFHGHFATNISQRTVADDYMVKTHVTDPTSRENSAKTAR